MQLAADSLEISAGRHVLLRNFSFRANQGEVVALAGPSGAGKSTLLETLAFLRPLRAGRLSLDGRDPRAWGIPQYRRQVMFVSGRPAFPSETIRTVLGRPFTYACSQRRFEANPAEKLLKELGLKPGLDASASTLSAGEAQRLALARALLLEPAFCLLDEPTGALDPAHRERTWALLRARVKTSNLGIVLVSHDTRDREALGGIAIEPRWIREPLEDEFDRR